MAGTPTITPIVLQRGIALEDPTPYYSVFSGRGGGGATEYHLMLEGTGEDAESRCAEALRALQAGLADVGTSSLTGAFPRVFRACNEALAATGSGGVGATCLACRGDDVFIAAVADISLFQLDQAGLRGVRPSSPGTLEAALGLGGDVTPAMERLDLHPGEPVLVTSNALAAEATIGALETILSSPPDAAIDRIATLMDKTYLFSALLITPGR